MQIEQELERMGLVFPETSVRATWLPAVAVDKLLFVSGSTGVSLYEQRGKVGRDLTTEQGYEAARYAVLGCLASIKAVVHDLDQVDRVVKLTGFINAVDGFEDTPLILNWTERLRSFYTLRQLQI